MAAGVSTAETGASAGQAALQNRVDTLSAKVAKTDGVAEAKRNLESQRGTPAEGMNLDSRYIAIQGELQGRWETEHSGQKPSEEDQSKLKSESDELFRERFPDDAKGYDAKEPTRIYEDPNQDPAIKRVEESILRATNSDPKVLEAKNGTDPDKYGDIRAAIQAQRARDMWDNFIHQYPEKAKAYAKAGDIMISQALQRQERSSQEQDKKAEVLAEKAGDIAQKAKEISDENKGGFKIPKSILEDKVYKEAYAEIWDIAKKQVGDGNNINKELVAKEALKLYYKKKLKGFLSTIAAVFVAPVFSAGWAGGQKVATPGR